MNYDPIKDSVGGFFNKSIALRKLFYRLLDILLLRTWHIHKEIKKWQQQNPGSRQILDAGCGFAQYSFWMSGLYPDWNIKAVDVKDDYLADCRVFFGKTGRNNVQFEVADLTKYSNPNAYEFVLCVDVMEHILEDVEVFKNFNASLRPGGMVLISTPSDKGGSDTDHNEGESFIGEHVRDGYPIEEIKHKLNTAGFNKVEARYAYGPWGMMAWRLSMKWPIKTLNTSKLFFLLLPFYYLLVMPFCLMLNWMDANLEIKEGAGLIVKAWKD